ncbi:putative Serpin family protein [Helianthus annuus]|nr:putative Serpin family protein [Helianthus annuus]
MLAFTSSSMDLKQPVSNQTHVSTTLATHLLSKKQDTNVVFSPLSIHVALSVLSASSKGQILDQILAFLKTNTTNNLNSLYLQLVSLIFFPNARPRRGPRLPFSSGGPRLSFANRFWVDKTLCLKPSFKHVVHTVYKSECKQVDYRIRNKAIEVANEMNSWTKEKTKGLIKQVITADEVSNVTWLIFANAVYFKGLWRDKFSPLMTKEYDFHLLDGNKVQVPFMTHHALNPVGVYDDFKVLCLPYLRGAMNKGTLCTFSFPMQKMAFNL